LRTRCKATPPAFYESRSAVQGTSSLETKLASLTSQMAKFRFIARALLLVMILTAGPVVAMEMEDCCCGDKASQTCEMPASKPAVSVPLVTPIEFRSCLTPTLEMTDREFDDCSCVVESVPARPLAERTVDTRPTPSFAVALLLLKAELTAPRPRSAVVAQTTCRYERPPKLAEASFSLYPLPPPA
jgi:hypothetical protein